VKRHNIEFLWGWFDALRRRDTESMAAALAPDVIWQGVRPDLVCHGPDEVIAAFVTAYDANQEIDSLEVIGGEERIVLGARSPDLAIDQVETSGEIYNVFTIEGSKSGGSRTTSSAEPLWPLPASTVRATHGSRIWGSLPQCATRSEGYLRRDASASSKTGVCDCRLFASAIGPVAGVGGRWCCQSCVMMTLPLARPCSTYAIASRAWSNGNVWSMSGRRWPAS
jgi:hypothetical protein